MKAAILEKPNTIRLADLPIPEPAFGQVRIKLSKVGICGSDVHLFLGHRLLNEPRVIGHEGIGTIDKLGEGVNTKTIGQRVVIEPNIPCQKCRHCLKGNGRYCPDKIVIGNNIDGCFAEFVCIDANFCWPIPDTISDEDALTIEPMAVALSALFKSNAKPGDTIAVLGLGAIGLLITHLALKLGYGVLVSEQKPEKLALATSWGAKAVKAEQETLNQAWENAEVECIFECAGSETTASLVTAAAPRGSQIVLLGLSEKLATFTPLKITREGISIMPSIIYDHPADFRRTIQLIASGIIQPGKIISAFYPLQDLQNALEKAAEGYESKVVLEIC